MVAFRPLVVALALALCGVEGALVVGAGGPGVVVTPVDTRVAVAAPVAAPVVAGVVASVVATEALEPEFLAHMTADDVARGVYALAAVESTADPVALTPAQRAAIGPLLREGAALRAELGELRMSRRAARDAWLADGAGLVATLGPARVAAGVGPTAPPPGGAR